MSLRPRSMHRAALPAVATLLAAGGAALCASLFATPALAADAGLVQFATGEVRVIGANGQSRNAARGATFAEGETVVTGPTGQAQLRMVDQGILALRPGTELRIDTYRFNGREDGTERSVLSLVRGGLRALTGLIGNTNKPNYLVNTPLVTIGVRGTDHEVVHIPPPAAGEVPVGPPGSYNKVNTGQTYMEGGGRRIEIGPNQVGFASPQQGVGPARLDSVPPFLRATREQQGRDDRRQARTDTQGDRRVAAGPGGPGRGPQQGGPNGPGPNGPGPNGQGPNGPGPNGPGPNGPGPGGKPVLPVNFADNSVNFAQASANLAVAQPNTAMVGGDRSGNALGSGGLVTGVNDAIFFGADGNPALISTAGGFRYARSGAPLIDGGGTVLADPGGGTPVRWGLYSGGAIVDNQGPRATDKFHFITARATPAVVQQTLTATYNTVGGGPKLVTESGVVGGSVTGINIAITAGKLTNYSLSATDGQARNWQVNCGTCTQGIPLTTFANKITLSGTGPGGAATGNANGQVVGPTGKGVITSFDLRTGSGQSVGGSVLAK